MNDCDSEGVQITGETWFLFKVDMEQWRDVVGFEGFYEVSDLGRVRRKGKHLLTLTTNGKGYNQVVLSKEGKLSTKLVHILVAGAFLPNPENLLYVAHKDDIGFHNILSNLYWATPKSNWEDRRRLGTDITGEKNSQAVLTWDKVRRIRKLKREGTTFDELVAIFAVSSSCIQNVVYNTTWKE